MGATFPFVAYKGARTNSFDTLVFRKRTVSKVPKTSVLAPKSRTWPCARQCNIEVRGTHGIVNVAPMCSHRDPESMNTLPDRKSLIHSLPDESVLPLVIEKRASPN